MAERNVVENREEQLPVEGQGAAYRKGILRLVGKLQSPSDLRRVYQYVQAIYIEARG